MARLTFPVGTRVRCPKYNARGVVVAAAYRNGRAYPPEDYQTAVQFDTQLEGFNPMLELDWTMTTTDLELDVPYTPVEQAAADYCRRELA